jgi:hypothetical protein
MTTFREKRNEIKRKNTEKYNSGDPFEKYLKKEITYNQLLELSGMKRYDVNMKIKQLRDGQ